MTAVSTALFPARRGDGRHRFSALIYDRLQRNHQQMNRQLAALAAFMILALITAAPVALAADGAKVYAEFCVVCHGAKGGGAHPQRPRHTSGGQTKKKTHHPTGATEGG